MSNSPLHRRQFLLQSGLGSLALGTLLAEETQRAAKPHFAPSADSIIYLFMAGGPSQVDTFDPKPELTKLAGKDVPESLARAVPRIKRAGLKNLFASHWKFARYGQSGVDISELLPRTAGHADELCVIRSLQHRNPVHGPSECLALTGTAAGDRPSIGAWSLYGLGSANDNLPAFLTMNLHSDGMQFPQAAGWSAGFLPAHHQATVVDPSRGIRFTKLPEGTDTQRRERELNLIRQLNERHLKSVGPQHELDARLRSYELAFRMQTAAPELFDLSKETEATRKLYGIDQPATQLVAQGCLLARRMVERGVRFMQVRVGGWDAHGNIKKNHTRQCVRTDQPIAALLQDLKKRGLLKRTLVVWGGEFGRTPTMEGRANGRDHSPAGYTSWLAGGGVKGGQIIGATDPIGYVATERPVSIPDFHATLLYSLGLDAHRLSYNHHGREEKPIVFGGNTVKEVFA